MLDGAVGEHGGAKDRGDAVELPRRSLVGERRGLGQRIDTSCDRVISDERLGARADPPQGREDFVYRDIVRGNAHGTSRLNI